MTEDEARKKWCPKARCAVKGAEDDHFVRGINRWPLDDGTTTGSKCFASDCMMWRWDSPVCVEEITTDPDHGPNNMGVEEARERGWVDSQRGSGTATRHWSRHEKHGYCGLAGEPK